MKPACNPYLPQGTYIPDGEPHVFDGRIYIYGSHDLFEGNAYCEGDYEAWSAPVDDLSDWRCDGVIFPRKNPMNPTGEKCMWAPDVCQGKDGKYYLYFSFGFENMIHVAVCDMPAGEYTYLGCVHHPDGTPYGQGPNDKMSFDPGVYCEEDGTVYLYSAFCPAEGLLNMLRSWGNTNCDATGNQVIHLGTDMMTVIETPKMLIPGRENSQGTGFEGHSFYEASSMRKVGDKYCFVYSSEVSHELCYAISDYPDKDFTFGGVLISNGDIGYNGNTQPKNYWGNNHGSIEKINDKWYVFYHRQTDRGETSRQGCCELLPFDNGFPMVEMTSQGMNGAPLPAEGSYSTSIACNLSSANGAIHCEYAAPKEAYADHPAITQETDENGIYQYINGMQGGSMAGFKYFVMDNVSTLGLTVRGDAGTFEIRLALEEAPIATISFEGSSQWQTIFTDITPISGIHPIYITFNANGRADVKTMHFSK